MINKFILLLLNNNKINFIKKIDKKKNILRLFRYIDIKNKYILLKLILCLLCIKYIKYSCLLTGRSRGLIGYFGYSRFIVKNRLVNLQLPGFIK